MPRRKQRAPESSPSPRLRLPEPRVQAQSQSLGSGRLDEYLTRRETAQSVPPRQALSAHPEVPDTLQTKRDPAALEARVQRARLLGHRWPR